MPVPRLDLVPTPVTLGSVRKAEKVIARESKTGINMDTILIKKGLLWCRD